MKGFSVITVFVFAFVFWSPAAAGGEITVSAAISLKNALEEIGTLYETLNRDAPVVYNFGASGKLKMQIIGGAPVDVFAPASVDYVEELISDGFINKNTKTDFARNSLVLIMPSSSSVRIGSFEDLKKSEIKKIAIGNPKTVPAGRYAEEIFHHFRIWEPVMKKVVFTEHVRQVLEYVARGEVDAGVVYGTDAPVKNRDVKIVSIAPDGTHKPILYSMGIVRGTGNEIDAKKFLDLVVSEEGQKIFRKYGFRSVNQP